MCRDAFFSQNIIPAVALLSTKIIIVNRYFLIFGRVDSCVARVANILPMLWVGQGVSQSEHANVRIYVNQKSQKQKKLA